MCPRRRNSGVGLSVKLGVHETAEKSTIEVTGFTKGIITDDQRAQFGIENAELKEMVNKYHGGSVNDVFTSDPTPWNNLYKTYKWEEVYVLLTAVDAEVIELTSNPVILGAKTLTNHSNVDAEFTTSISESVTESFSSTWNSSLASTLGQEVSYGVEGIAGGKTSFSFTTEFGESETTSHQATVGAASGVTVVLRPKQSVIAKLSASRGTLKARVTYEARLGGLVACNYNPTFKGHHFWALGIQNVMTTPSVKMITQDIDVGYYSTGNVTLESLE